MNLCNLCKNCGSIFCEEGEAVQKKQIVTIINNEPLLTIKWRLTTWCNYRCSYCIQFWGEKEKKTDFNKLLEIAKEVNRLIESASRPVKLYLLGLRPQYLYVQRVLSSYRGIQNQKPASALP